MCGSTSDVRARAENKLATEQFPRSQASKQFPTNESDSTQAALVSLARSRRIWIFFPPELSVIAFSKVLTALSSEQVKRLILNADDFGLTPGVSRGIVEAFQSGVVRSTSAMLCIDETVAQLKQWRSLIEGKVGVHLQLMDGAPCAGAARVPSLTNESGLFPTSPTPVNGISPAEVREEWHAQVERLMSNDFVPTHLDAHNHVHIVPEILDVYCDIALYYGLPARSGPPRVAAKLKERGVAGVDYCDIRGYGGAITPEVFLKKVEHAFAECGASGVVEMMCHPGYVDAALKGKSVYAEEREQELDLLCSAAVREGLQQMGVEVVGWLQ